MLPMPATTFWSRIKGFIWALREPRVSRKYSTSKPSSRGSGPRFARRAPVARTPSRRRTNSSLEGCSTNAGSRTSAPSIPEPTTSPRRSSFMVSTSGSSGMRLLVPPGDADGTRERDGFLVDGPIQPVEHDRAGVERAHGPLPHPPLTLLVPGVGGEGLHHDAGVLYVHGDVAGEDLQSLVRQPRRPLQTLGETHVDGGHGPLARRPQSPEAKPDVRVPAQRVVSLYVELYLGERPGRLPFFLAYPERKQETPVEGRMGLAGVQVPVLVE